MEQNPLERAQVAVAVESSPVVKFSKIDAMASLILGFIIGVFTPLILNNVGKTLPFQDLYFAIFPALALIGMWVVYLFASRVPVLVQIAKFGAIGVANTAIDFGVLNSLAVIAQVFSGLALVPLNIISFSIAVINSYFWNKYWTFKAGSPREVGKENSKRQFIEFIIVSVIGVLINTGIVYLVTTFASPFAGVSDAVWLNIGKLAATFISLVWNFVGYKFVVFKK